MNQVKSKPNQTSTGLFPNIFKRYRYTFLMLALLWVAFLLNRETGIKATSLTLSNIKTMLSVLPAIFILIGLLDVWVPKEVMIKYMGEDSGIKGILLAFLLGTLAAGPLYAAFPVAALLVKKGAKLSNVLFFLGVWSSTKLPLLLFEYSALGATFTTLHVLSSVSVYLIGANIIEHILSVQEKKAIYERLS